MTYRATNAIIDHRMPAATDLSEHAAVYGAHRIARGHFLVERKQRQFHRMNKIAEPTRM